MNQFNLNVPGFDNSDEPPLPRPDFDAYLQQSTRHELKQQIILNQSNSFTPEQLDSFSTEQLRGIASLATGNTSAKTSSHHVHDGGLFGGDAVGSEYVMHEEAPLPRPTSWI